MEAIPKARAAATDVLGEDPSTYDENFIARAHVVGNDQ